MGITRILVPIRETLEPLGEALDPCKQVERDLWHADRFVVKTMNW